MLNLSTINTNTIEGRLLIAAIGKIQSLVKSYTESEVLTFLDHRQREVYKDAEPIPEAKERPPFSEALTTLINTYSKESTGNTPDFILSSFLEACLNGYNQAINQRDKYFNFKPWAIIGGNKIPNKESGDDGTGLKAPGYNPKFLPIPDGHYVWNREKGWVPLDGIVIKGEGEEQTPPLNKFI